MHDVASCFQAINQCVTIQIKAMEQYFRCGTYCLLSHTRWYSSDFDICMGNPSGWPDLTVLFEPLHLLTIWNLSVVYIKCVNNWTKPLHMWRFKWKLLKGVLLYGVTFHFGRLKHSPALALCPLLSGNAHLSHTFQHL